MVMFDEWRAVHFMTNETTQLGKALDTYILSAVYIVTEESPLPFLSSSYVCILSYLQCK